LVAVARFRYRFWGLLWEESQPLNGILEYGNCPVRSKCSLDDAWYVGRDRDDTWYDVGRYSMGRRSGALYHLAERDALRHHLLRPDPCLELLSTILRFELVEVLVRLRRPGIVVIVPLAAGRRLGAAPPPGEVSL
jgi:hypothetical protein